MARKKKPVEPPEDIPKWFMTYSDVITLLMTFFILLLTFATNEPERFEKMKISMFGASGSAGIAGEKTEGVDRDSLVLRVRPDSSRKAEHGSDMPPIDKDAPDAALEDGLSGLENDVPQIELNTIKLTMPASQLASTDGEIFEFGQKNLVMFANLAQQRPLDLVFETSDENNLPRIMALVDYSIKHRLIDADRIVVNCNSSLDLPPSKIRAIVNFTDGINNVSRFKEVTK